jgi:hypothetical protein
MLMMLIVTPGVLSAGAGAAPPVAALAPPALAAAPPAPAPAAAPPLPVLLTVVVLAAGPRVMVYVLKGPT